MSDSVYKGEAMGKLTHEEYMAVLDDADSSPAPELSEAERLAAHADAPVKVSDRQRDKPLTAKQILFAQGVVSGKSMKQAYRDAYDTQASDSVVSTSANKLIKHPKIAAMLEEAWGETVEALVDDAAATKRYVLRQLIAHSKSAKQEGSKIKALELMGKAVGLFVERTESEVKHVTADQLKNELAGHLRLLDSTRGKRAA